MVIKSILVLWKKYSRYIFFCTFFMLFLSTASFAQQRTITGTVTSSDDNLSLPGVNVFVQGTTTGTITDLDGKYTIEVTDGDAVLQFSFIGYNTELVTVGSNNVIDIVLTPSLVALDEVVVTSLGIKREKKQITYSAQNVDPGNLTQARELNVNNSLAGKVAGVDIIKSSAGVGSASRVIIRGNRSVAGNNQPLYIVDGVPISNSTWDTPENENGGVQSGDGISNINPDDIESITVLKGPNAVALYGARAANGAVVITTKKGVARKGIGVEFNTNASMDRALILTKYQHVYGQGNSGVYNTISEEGWGPKMTGQMVDHWTNNPNYEGPAQYAYSPHNNFEEFFQTGYNLANTLTLTSGGDKVRALFSYTNTIAKGIVETNKLLRNNFNLRIDGNLTDKFSFDTKLTYFNQGVDNRLATGDGFENPMRAIYRQPSSISLDQVREYEFFDDIGTRRQHYWNPNTNGGENIYWMLNRTIRREDRNRILGMGSLRYQFTENLSLMVRSSFDVINETQSYKAYHDTYTIHPAGNLQLDNRNSLELNHDFLLNYNSRVGDDLLSINVNVGGNMLSQKNESLRTETNRLLKPNLFSINNTSQINSDQDGWEKKVNSLYGFITIGFKDFLFLDVTGRNDWSSTLPKENWSYFYPSVGLSWIITEMVPTDPGILTFAKVRASYAEVGNDTDPYAIHNTYEFSSGGQLGYANRGSTLAAQDLKPENTRSIELGADVRFLNNRLGIDFTWYKTNTFNQLIEVPLPDPSGFSAKFINAGNIQNKGVEITLNANPVKIGDFSWDLQFNFAANENIAIEITDELTEYTTRSGSWMTTHQIVEGEDYDQVYTRGFVRDANNRILINNLVLPIVTTGHSVRMGSGAPDWMGGLTNNFNWKGLMVSVLLDMRMGGKTWSFTEANLTFDGLSEATLEGREGMVVDGVYGRLDDDGNVEYLDADENVSDTPVQNTTQTVAEAYWHALGGRNSPTGEPYTYDASYIRLREILVGYTWNLNTSVIQSISLSLYGRNLGFLYNPSEIVDPGMSVSVGNFQGVEGFGIPTTRTFGLNARFKF
jgi:TonB-linked SusC/RagA family outer membrane protein